MSEFDEKTKELMREAGREMAVDLMESACKNAETKEQMHSQMKVLSYMAKHILATITYNITRQQSANEEVALNMLLNDLRKEFRWIKETPEEDLEFSGPKAGSSDE